MKAFCELPATCPDCGHALRGALSVGLGKDMIAQYGCGAEYQATETEPKVVKACPSETGANALAGDTVVPTQKIRDA